MHNEYPAQVPQRQQQLADIADLPTGRVPAVMGEPAISVAIEDVLTQRIPAVALLMGDTTMTAETTALPATRDRESQPLPRMGQWTSNPPGDLDDGIDIWPTEILPSITSDEHTRDITIAPTRRLG